jgi:hypothetical protein
MKLNGEEIQKLYLSGLSTVTLSQNYGVSKVAILYHLHKLKTPMRHSPGVSESLICDGYINGNSTIELGKVWGCSHTRIASILERNNIPIRSKKEALEKYARINMCVICGKPFRPKLHWTDTNGHTRKTCSKECHSQLMHNVQMENNSNMKHGGSQGRYQRIRRELKPDVCEKCGATLPTRIDTHHKDRDKTNNNPSNIMVLCVNCHAYLHYLEDDRGLKGWKKR